MSTFNGLEWTIENTPELWRLRDSLHKDAREDLELFLGELFKNHDTIYGIYAPSDPTQEVLLGFCQDARSLAKRYVDHPQWHTPWLTRYLLVDILDGQQRVLEWTAKWGVYSGWSSRRHLSAPYRSFVPPLVSLVILLLSVWLLVWLLDKERFLFAVPLGLWMGYFYLIQKPITWWRRWKHRRHFLRLATLLTIPLGDVESSNYDPETISRRLEACEQKDLQVASIAFALLKLHPHPQAYHQQPSSSGIRTSSLITYDYKDSQTH